MFLFLQPEVIISPETTASGGLEMESKMSNAKKSTKKAVVVKVLRTRKPNALHEKLVKLFTRPTGATVQDVAEVKFYGPAIAALRIVERRGYKTNVIKKSGELSRYVARKA
jgi:tRNA U34 5-carboxymethylaminomethyl modifying GTPase MnmE/TrmE